MSVEWHWNIKLETKKSTTKIQLSKIEFHSSTWVLKSQSVQNTKLQISEKRILLDYNKCYYLFPTDICVYSYMVWNFMWNMEGIFRNVLIHWKSISCSLTENTRCWIDYYICKTFSLPDMPGGNTEITSRKYVFILLAFLLRCSWCSLLYKLQTYNILILKLKVIVHL